jgi:magnesium chelatase family protein
MPTANAQEAALAPDITIYPATHLLEVCQHLLGKRPLSASPPTECDTNPFTDAVTGMDLADIRGQPQAKRALEIAAAGGHSMLMMGPPGTGKTMAAHRLATILPPPTLEEALEIAAVYSTVHAHIHTAAQVWKQRPFRSPHHTASGVALVGGGSAPRPGEISLAHHGVLFLDELPEFDRRVLEVLREPLESGHILISRAARQVEFPAQFQLITAMNPCPCGYLGDPNPKHRCQCHPEQIRRYRARISQPLLDRIDMHLEVPALPPQVLASTAACPTEDSHCVRTRVIAAAARQRHRCHRLNARLTQPETLAHCVLEPAAQQLLSRAMEHLGLSARSYHRILRVARTIADLAAESTIHAEHMSEALSFRKMDRAS